MPSFSSMSHIDAQREARERKSELAKIRQAMLAIPSGTAQCTRYDTDDKHVLSVFCDGKTYDIEIPK